MLQRKFQPLIFSSRLPDHVGTRLDVSELIKDSQYIAEGLTDNYVSELFITNILDKHDSKWRFR
jgi:hypothetical protein